MLAYFRLRGVVFGRFYRVMKKKGKEKEGDMVGVWERRQMRETRRGATEFGLSPRGEPIVEAVTPTTKK